MIGTTKATAFRIHGLLSDYDRRVKPQGHHRPSMLTFADVTPGFLFQLLILSSSRFLVVGLVIFVFRTTVSFSPKIGIRLRNFRFMAFFFFEEAA